LNAIKATAGCAGFPAGISICPGLSHNSPYRESLRDIAACLHSVEGWAEAVVLTVTQIDRDKPAKAAMSLTNILPTTRQSKFFRIIGSTAAFVRPKGRAQGVAAFDADAWPSFQLNSMP
jgi:hypothetical protein